MKQKEKIYVFDYQRKINPLPLDFKYLSQLSKKVQNHGMFGKEYVSDILEKICNLLKEWKNINKRNSITFEEFVEYFNDEKTFASKEIKTPKSADYYSSLYLFRTCAFMLYIQHKFLDSLKHAVEQEKEEK